MTRGSHWRGEAAAIIAEVIERVGREDEKALRAALREAYPFGQRRYHPYRIWCDEVGRQLGTKPPLGSAKTIKSLPGQRYFTEVEQ